MSDLTDTKKLQVRVYETQVDDSGRMMWLAEAGWPSETGAGWISFAETCAYSTELAATEALFAMLQRRERASAVGIRRLSSLMVERGFQIGLNGRMKHAGRVMKAIGRALSSSKGKTP